MNVLITIFAGICLFVIIGLLNEILGELRLAKKDREDDRSQKPSWVDPRKN